MIWLGFCPSSLSAEIFELIEITIDELITAIEEGFDPEEGLGATAWLPNQDAKEILETVAPLFRCEWFTRTWTIQEAGLTDNATALWGEQTIEFRSISLFFMLYSKYYRAVAEM